LKKNLDQVMADSMEANKDILPYLPELLVDLWALGSSPELMVELLRPLKLPELATRVLDLGCGKGAVAITLAKELGFTTLGIDANKAFLKEAEEKAGEYQVADRCQFQFGDIREAVGSCNGFDIVVYASLGGILGKFIEIVGKLRETVKPNGYILVDDGFIKGDHRVERPGYGHYASYDQTIAQLTEHGDRLIQEQILSDEYSNSINYGYLDAIKKRGQELINRRPHADKLITEYIDNQEVECEFLDRHLSGAIWLLQKNNPSPAKK
jgi:cyclopropane fatty-acyl-phospholipid synthase-like methyltransferase